MEKNYDSEVATLFICPDLDLRYTEKGQWNGTNSSSKRFGSEHFGLWMVSGRSATSGRGGLSGLGIRRRRSARRTELRVLRLTGARSECLDDAGAVGVVDD